jgi:hypothetical protein
MKKSIILLFSLFICCGTQESINGTYINSKEKYETLIINNDLSYKRIKNLGMVIEEQTGFLYEVKTNKYLILDSVISKKPLKFDIIEKDSLNLKNEIVLDFFDKDGYEISYIELNIIKNNDTTKHIAISNKIILNTLIDNEAIIYINMLGYWPINYLPKKSNSNYFKITMFESPFCHFCNDSVLYFNNDTVK